MRNLKRVLSLALASTMLLGMMVIGAGAADETKAYTDSVSINNKEAVEVMTAIGVFQGTDGKFNPAAELTRESAAKVICYMLMGKTEADKLATTAAPFTDVAADRWSAGSIAYCVSQGIISGDGMGHFFPEMTINGVGFAKMVLVALGYKADTEGFTGNGYEANITKAAINAKINTGLGSLAGKLTREKAAQMAFNGLKALTVSYEGGINITNADGSSVVTGGTRKTGATFMAANYPTLKATAGVPDAMGRPGTQWKLGTKKVGTYGATAAMTYTTDLTDAAGVASITSDITALGGMITSVSVAGPSYYLNGAFAAKSALVADAAKIAALTGAGRTVELYVDNDVVSTVVIVDTYIAKIASINSVSKTVSLSGIASLEAVGEKDTGYAELSGMKKGDRVLVTVAANKVTSVAVPETAVGTYTAKSAKPVYTVGDSTYSASMQVAKLPTEMGTEYTLYLDKCGNIIDATGEAVSEAKYGFVLNTDTIGGASTGVTSKVQIVLADGTQEWVTVASSLKTTDAAGVSEEHKSSATNFKAKLESLVGSFVSYSVKGDGSYSLVQVANNGSANIDGTKIGATTGFATAYRFTNAKITKNVPVFFGGTNTNDILGTSKTVFLVGTKDNTYKAYTGISNIPGWTNAYGKVLVAPNTNSANMVLVDPSSSTVATKDLVFITAATGSAYNADLKETVNSYKAIVDAKEVTLYSTVASKALGLYTIDSYKGTVADGLTAVTDALDDTSKPTYTTGLTAALNAGHLTLKDGTIKVTVSSVDKYFATADGFQILAVKTNGNITPIAADEFELYAGITGVCLIKNADKFVTTMIFVYA